ncbi:MAG: YchF/TatD family DNA exonuclease [Planctomycetes bacterium]|nr:YchF/TatD family DNA exonuclease [Planctomycetota bacterium]
MLIDSHAHLHFDDYKGDLDAVINRAREAGVGFIIDVGTTLESTKASLALSGKYPFIYSTAGVHPHDADKMTEGDWMEFERLLAHPKVVAIGEIGLDYFKNYSPHDAQKSAFIRQLGLVKKYNKPVIIHCREAHQDCKNILKAELKAPVRGVIHCFSGNADDAKFYLDMGFHISIGGPITYPKADSLRSAVKTIPIERLLLETDCPFLTPQSQRGKRNEPAFLRLILPVFAGIYGLSTGDVERITSLNAAKFFGISEFHDDASIAYPIRDSLYLNITNRCTNKCNFCVRFFSDYVKGHNLRLGDKEPAVEEIKKAMGDFSQYKEIVFCGLGEPTLRLDVLKEIAVYAKQKGIKVRINTNGHGNIINGRLVCKELSEIIDSVAISLNAPDAQGYYDLCRPDFGLETYDGLLDFVRDAKAHIKEVQVTVVAAPGIDVEACKRIAGQLGVPIRIRTYNEVG